MAAFCVGRIRVTNPAVWEGYRGAVGATIAQYGGEVVFRSEAAQAFQGQVDHDIAVVLRFADMDAARRWHDSPEYQALIPARDAGAEVTLTLYRDWPDQKI